MADENDFDGQDGGALRKQLEKVLADNKALSEKLTAFEMRERTSAVEKALSEKGLNPKLARFVSAEEGSDPAKLDAWIKDNADLFGPAQPAEGAGTTEPQGKPSVPQEAATAYNAIQKVSENGAHTVVDLSSLQAQIKAAKDPAELNALLSQYQIS